jgi:hypothetical protein
MDCCLLAFKLISRCWSGRVLFKLIREIIKDHST